MTWLFVWAVPRKAETHLRRHLDPQRLQSTAGDRRARATSPCRACPPGGSKSTRSPNELTNAGRGSNGNNPGLPDTGIRLSLSQSEVTCSDWASGVHALRMSLTCTCGGTD
jgi:hypothetical protein